MNYHQFRFGDNKAILLIVIFSLLLTTPILHLFSAGYDSGYHMSKSNHLFQNFPYVGWKFENYFGTVANLYPPLSYYFVSILTFLFNIELSYSVARIFIFAAIPVMIFLLLREFGMNTLSAFVGPLVLLGSWMYIGDVYVTGFYPQDFSIFFMLVFLVFYFKSQNNQQFSIYTIFAIFSLTATLLSHYYTSFVLLPVLFISFLVNPLKISRLNLIKNTLIILGFAIGLSMFFYLNFIDGTLNKTLVNLYCCEFNRAALVVPQFDFYQMRFFFGFPFFIIMSIVCLMIVKKYTLLKNRLVLLSSVWFSIFLLLSINSTTTDLSPSPDRQISFVITFFSIFSSIVFSRFYNSLENNKTRIALFLLLFCLTITSAIIGVSYMIISNPFLAYPEYTKNITNTLNLNTKKGEVIFNVSTFNSMWFNVYSDKFQSAGVEGQSAVNKKFMEKIASVRDDPIQMRELMTIVNSRYIIVPTILSNSYANNGFEPIISNNDSTLMQVTMFKGNQDNIFSNSAEFLSDKIIIKLTINEAQDFLIPQSYHKYWHATIDGTPTSIHANELGLMVINVNVPGYHVIVLEHYSELVHMGFIFSFATLILLVIISCIKFRKKITI